MSAGVPLDDADRYPWLERAGRWLARHSDGGVMSCSALKRRYRDHLRRHCPGVEFLHLTGAWELIVGRLAHRTDHFMPPALLQSQFDTLEPLGPDENGVVLDCGAAVDAIVDTYLARAAPPIGP
jgi:gluconokinase